MRVALDSRNRTWKVEAAEELIVVLECSDLQKDRLVELALSGFSQLQQLVAVEIVMAEEKWIVVGYERS